MDWKTALAACGFEYSEKTNTAYFHFADHWSYWAVQLLGPRIGDGAWRASLSYGNQSNAHEDTLAEVEGETADRAFMALLNEKVGPGGVTVAEFIGNEKARGAFDQVREAEIERMKAAIEREFMNPTVRPLVHVAAHFGVTLDAYQNDANRTNSTDSLANKALGLCGEAGEVAEQIKKHLYHGHPLDREKLVNELGDVLWYIATLASDVGVSLSDVAAGNVAKLRRRYPDGFSAERSVNREEVRNPVAYELAYPPRLDDLVEAPDDLPPGALLTYRGAPVGLTPRAVRKGEEFFLMTNNLGGGV